MAYKKILTIQDISCVGQCSLTVALPIISCLGHECAVLPSSILSNHTGGFKSFSLLDISKEMANINKQWQNNNISFDYIYTGYQGNKEQINNVLRIFNTSLKEKGLKIVDPAMADNGKLYTGFDKEFVKEMKKLVLEADVILPNLTEACLLTDTEFKNSYDQEYILDILNKLSNKKNMTIILTGISYQENKTGVVIYKNNNYYYYMHDKIAKSYHGTGDIFASCYVGLYAKGMDEITSAKIAADFVVRCIKATLKDQEHFYGVKFETQLPFLLKSFD